MGTQPRVFEDLDTAHLWLAATFADWVRELTEPERDALALYKGEGYREVNGALRGTVDMTEQVETTVEDLDVAIARMALPGRLSSGVQSRCRSLRRRRTISSVT